jgi:hypothetical protein
MLGASDGSDLWSIDLDLDRRLQIGGRRDRLGRQLVNRMITCEHSHRRDEQSEVDDFHVAVQTQQCLADRRSDTGVELFQTTCERTSSVSSEGRSEPPPPRARRRVPPGRRLACGQESQKPVVIDDGYDHASSFSTSADASR